MRQLIFYYTVAFMFDDFVLLNVVVNILCISRQSTISHDILSTLPQITQFLSHSGIRFNSQIFKPSLNYLFLLNILQKKKFWQMSNEIQLVSGHPRNILIWFFLSHQCLPLVSEYIDMKCKSPLLSLSRVCSDASLAMFSEYGFWINFRLSKSCFPFVCFTMHDSLFLFFSCHISLQSHRGKQGNTIYSFLDKVFN